MDKFKKPANVVLALMLVILSGVISAPLAHAESAYPIAFTEIGIYPRVAPSMDSERNGDALPDGTMVTIECELEGQPVSNGMATISVWAKTPHGYLPNSFLLTGVDGWTPGISKCEQPKPEPQRKEDPTAGIKPLVPRTGDRRVFIEYDPSKHDDLHVANVLYSHYYSVGKKAGADVIVDWRFFADRKALREAAYKVQIGDYGRPAFDAKNLFQEGNTFGLATAMGSFTIYRRSEHCFTLYDYYDFAGSVYVIEWADSATGRAHTFNVFSWGCYQ